MERRQRTKRSDEQWEGISAEFKASGLTQQSFCEQHDLAVSVFRRRYQKSAHFEGKRRTSGAPRFQQVRPTAPPQMTHGVVIRLNNTVSIECPPSAGVDTVAALARALAS